MAARQRRYFTANEVAAMILDEEDDDWLLGGGEERHDGGSDNDDDAGEEAQGPDAQSTRNADSDVEDEDGHFLDVDANTDELAREFLDDEGQRGAESASGAASEQAKSSQDVRCGCSHECLRKLAPEVVEANRLNVADLEKSEKEMLVLGILDAQKFDEEVTQRGKKRKKRVAFRYKYEGQNVCVGAFRFIYNLGSKEFRNLVAHLCENGPVPRIHGNKGRAPRHALKFPTVKRCADFIKNFSEVHGLPQPAPLHGRDGLPPIYLPASMNYKTVHAQYISACEGEEREPLAITSFRGIWHQCFPHIKFMTPRTDVCQACEDNRQAVTRAVSEQDKETALAKFSNHLTYSSTERAFYRQCSEQATEELGAYQFASRPPFLACSQDLVKTHYTFDFAQQVTLPHTARQVGPIYFKTPRKVQIFGVCSEGIPRQVNYLIDEAQTIGVNGTKSHNPNTVVSLLHHFFASHGHGERECHLHADNCAGQNKNKTLLAYLAWRVIVGLHVKVSLHFMTAGHTRCLVDGCFGLVKQKYRRSDTHSLGQLVDVVNSSAACNVAELVDSDRIPWYNWDSYLPNFFKPLKGISRLQHFELSAEKKGVVVVNKTADGERVEHNLLKPGVDLAALAAAVLPPILQPGGLTMDRQKYLYEKIREHVAPAHKDSLCPQPMDAD